MAIGVLLIAIAVPSIAGMIAEQRLRESFRKFDRLASLARHESVTTQRECRLVWDRKGISLFRQISPEDAGEDATEERLSFDEKESFQLRRTAALQKSPSDEWAFWSNGTCEPVHIAYEGPAGKWQVRYDPLTAHATFLSSEVR
jgi:Tfp pilus assembly protein FimT